MGRLIKFIINGNKFYILWVTLLLTLTLIGLHAYSRQLIYGLCTTGMGDEVSWGFYIANFAFLVGMAAAAVMIVIPVYIFHDKELKKIVIFAELFAISAVIMCLSFVLIDLGRIDRIWHLIPGIGIFHWPQSMLTWDVIVLNGYLFINIFLCSYFLIKIYKNSEPKTWIYLLVVFISIVWAPSIHTVTAFLFQGLGARPFWHSPLIAPRFLSSAFSAGPAFILIVLILLKKFNAIKISPHVIRRIRQIVTICLLINIFFFFSEVFAELYMPTSHSINLAFLLGVKGKSILTPWIRLSVVMSMVSAIMFLIPKLMEKEIFIIIACILTDIGIWLEKGLGFVIPGFIPTPIGDFVEYKPTLNEVLITIGVWAGGLLIYTILVKLALPIINGELRKEVR